MKVAFRYTWSPSWGAEYYGGHAIGQTSARFAWRIEVEKAKTFDSLEEAQEEAKRFWSVSWQDFEYVEVLDGNQTKVLAAPEGEGRSDSIGQAPESKGHQAASPD